MRATRIVLVLVGLLLAVGTAVAQDASGLTLRLHRDFGFGAGGRIQGTFSFRVDGPENLERVLFLIDDEPIGKDTEAPFRLQFQTTDFAPGSHTLRAVGFTTDGQELRSLVLRREFVTGAEAGRLVLWIIIPILILVIGGRLVSSWIAGRGREKSGLPVVNGPFGGAICPQCGRPFALHIWGLNVVVGKYDRCPHCGRWGLARRAHPAALQAAAEEMAAAEDETPPPEVDEQEALRRRLEDSRFDDQTD